MTENGANGGTTDLEGQSESATGASTTGLLKSKL
jgi:hypothetical protein